MTREQQLELECIELNARLAEMTAKCAQAQAQLMRINLKERRTEFDHAKSNKTQEQAPQPPGVEA